MTYDVNEIRAHFPSLQGGTIFLDNPAGTQVPREVIDAASEYYLSANANTQGVFPTSRRTAAVIDEARGAMAEFLNASSPEEIVFGPNMTTLTYGLSRALGRALKEGDEIIVTRLDHDANIAPWTALREQGARVRWVDIDPEDCTLNMSEFEESLTSRTKIVAVGYASNAVGTINDLDRIIRGARGVGALVFVDAVHYAPHGPIDVQALGCDFLVCSAYKFYGPHVGVLFGKGELLDRVPAYQVRPAGDRPPGKWETGTKNHEGLAGLGAALGYLTGIGKRYGAELASHSPPLSGRRLHLKRAMSVIERYERELFTRLMEGLGRIPGIRFYGITGPERFAERTPTVAFTLEGFTPREVAEQLARGDICVWEGHHYALTLTERLRLEESGGTVRVGLAHYNTPQEVERLLTELEGIGRKGVRRR